MAPAGARSSRSAKSNVCHCLRRTLTSDAHLRSDSLPSTARFPLAITHCGKQSFFNGLSFLACREQWHTAMLHALMSTPRSRFLAPGMVYDSTRSEAVRISPLHVFGSGGYPPGVAAAAYSADVANQCDLGHCGRGGNSGYGRRAHDV